MTKYYILLFVSVFTNVIAQTLIKKGALILDLSRNFKSIVSQLLKNYFIFSGLLTYIISFILMIIILTKIEIIRVYPINFALGFLLIIILSNIFIGEKITYNILLGGTFILLGIYFIVK